MRKFYQIRRALAPGLWAGLWLALCSGPLAAAGMYNAPAAPTNLVATAVSGTQVNLTWTDNSSNEGSFEIERSPYPGSGYVRIATVGANVKTYTNGGLATQIVYYYRVRAVALGVPSAYSLRAGVVLGKAPIVMTNGEVSTCDALFLDPGGVNNYPFNRAYTMTIAPGQAGTKVRVTFSYLSMIRNSTSSDYLWVYDGANTSAAQLPVTTSYDQVFTATNPTGKLTFLFSSDAQGSGGGWHAKVTCVVPPPSDLTAVATSGTATKLTWKDNATGESGFRIERSLSPSSGFTQIATVGANVTTYSNTGLTPANYFYRVRAYLGAYQTPPSNLAQVVMTTSPVKMTSAVVATCGTTFTDGGGTANYGNNTSQTLVLAPPGPGNSVRVTFNAFSTETGNDVLYVYNGGSTSAPLLNAYSGNAIPPVLTASNGEGKLTFRFVTNGSVTAAGWQATVSCVTRPAQPTNLTAAVVTANQAKLTWTDNGVNETGFKIERSTYPNREFTQIATVGPNVTTYTNLGLLPNTVYYYRVRSYLDGFNTFYSNTASAINSPQVILVNKRINESTVVAACNAIVLDGGGVGNYAPGGQYVREIVPSTPGTKVRLVIEFADFDSGDRVTILDGGKNDGKVIAEYPGEWWLPLEALATNPEGKLTVIVSNDSDNQVSSGFQGRVSCTPTSEPPIDLFATVLSSTQVKLGWTDVSTTESGFKIYRAGGSAGTDAVQIATVGANVTSFTDVNLEPNQFYYYRVRSFAGSTFESALTPVVSVLATNRIINMQNGTVTTCDASFFDAGGPGWGNNPLGEDFTLTIVPATAGKMVRLKFFELGAPLGVRFRIYDGASTSAPLLFSAENEDVYPFTVTATNSGGRLTIRSECDGLRLADWYGEITCVSPTAARLDAGAEAATGAAFGARLQPNPVRTKLMVTLDESARGVTRTEVTDGTGRVRLLNGHKVASENTLELDVHALRPGLFLLYVQTDKGRRVLKFVKE